MDVIDGNVTTINVPAAEHFGLPLLPASKAGGDFKKGANMAIIGATTMDFDFFKSIGLSDKIWNNGPLGTQIQWFRQLLPSACGKDCKRHLSKSLFVVGEFGGNDYNAALFSGRTMADVRGYVPQVVSHIIRGLETMIRLGAMDVVVPGVLPIGCFPIYLTLYGTSNGADYDGDGCLKSYNDLSSHHNSLLRRSLANLQRTYPHTRIMYADFYSQVIHMIRAPQNFGKPISSFRIIMKLHSTRVHVAKNIRVKAVIWRAVWTSPCRHESSKATSL
jgi:phospholipase/lecithinase/hemolysin